MRMRVTGINGNEILLMSTPIDTNRSFVSTIVPSQVYCTTLTPKIQVFRRKSMLSEESRGVIEFIDECRAQGMIKDELYLKEEEMWRTLSDLEVVMKRSPEDRALYWKLETLISEAIVLVKDTYFEYGENFESTQMNKLIAKVNKEAM